jgi:hypothetical protein
MPKSHQKHAGRTASSLIDDAARIGPSTGRLVEAILATKRHPEMGYRSCLGILRLAKIYPAERAAAHRALRARAYNYQSMESILRNQPDRLPLPGSPPAQPSPNTKISAAPITSMPRPRPIHRKIFNQPQQGEIMLNQQR